MTLEERTILDIIEKIDNLTREVDPNNMRLTASKIVNLIWSNKNIRLTTLEEDYYLELNNVAELAADIELYEDSDYRRELWRALIINLDIMKKKLGMTPNP